MEKEFTVATRALTWGGQDYSRGEVVLIEEDHPRIPILLQSRQLLAGPPPFQLGVTPEPEPVVDTLREAPVTDLPGESSSDEALDASPELPATEEPEPDKKPDRPKLDVEEMLALAEKKAQDS